MNVQTTIIEGSFLPEGGGGQHESWYRSQEGFKYCAEVHWSDGRWSYGFGDTKAEAIRYAELQIAVNAECHIHHRALDPGL